MVPSAGIEPATTHYKRRVVFPVTPTWHVVVGLHLRRDSNPCPLADKASALPTELRRLWCQVQGSNPQLPIIKGGLCFQLHQPGSFWLLEDAIVLLYKVMIERQEKWRKFTEISQGLLYVRW